MSSIQWTADLELGISVIDSQHKRIVRYINQLEELPEESDRKAVGEVLDELVDYTLSHFAFEEELMEESDYRFVNAHKRVHQLFVRKVGSYVERFQLGENVTEELLVSLKTWLVNHIRNDDKDYAASVKQNMGSGNASKRGWMKRALGKVFGLD